MFIENFFELIEILGILLENFFFDSDEFDWLSFLNFFLFVDFIVLDLDFVGMYFS